MSGVGSRGLIPRLGKIKLVHVLIDRIGLYRLLNGLLRRRPILRRLPRSGCVIRISSVAGLALADEMFKGQSYLNAVQKSRVETFVDLGCNVGWFPCFLLEAVPGSSPVGLLVDADPKVVEDARWHVQRNRLDGCEVLCGAVGCPSGQSEVVFYVNPANTQSSAQPFGKNHPFPIKGTVREVRVPTLDMSREWAARHGDRQIDLLKLDIEGLELDFLRAEIRFLETHVRRIVCEWHAWHVTLPEIEAFLRAHRFALEEIAQEDETGGVAIFARAAPG